jgi:hypothetical protein
MTTPALESALAKLREEGAMTYLRHCAALGEQCADGLAYVRHEYLTALLAKIEAADSTLTAIRAVHNMEPLPPVVLELIAAYRAPQPAGGGE